MASLIQCPHCGARPKEEFSIKGSAEAERPAPDAAEDAWFEYVYQRDNPIGRIEEYWQHTSGCRRWLVVERDSGVHTVYRVLDATAARSSE
ncbi:MAG: sarcosine oxidase subunit delta [Rhodospirillales bacterium]|nr:sarcosine oxidase subunit delta [Rhodospirillales bacterium]MBO6785725.1 sarcosine oxidase subunit delta [Rhodospirillales bacterium]